MQCEYLEKYFALTGEQDSVSAAINVTLHSQELKQCSHLNPLGFNLKMGQEPQGANDDVAGAMETLW
jgi:hypothetical protein